MEEDQYDKFAKKMEEAYPEMFSEPYGGFAVGKGWYHIIESICFQIQSHHEHMVSRVERNKKLNALIDAYHAGDKAGLEEYCKWQSLEDVLEAGHQDVTPPTQVRVRQIKEKFGGLRFYYDGGDDYVSGVVSMAESWAGKSCETCGSLGTRRDGGWIRTLCDTHEAAHQEEVKKRGY
mgnify:CR=1 FL=1